MWDLLLKCNQHELVAWSVTIIYVYFYKYYAAIYKPLQTDDT